MESLHGNMHALVLSCSKFIALCPGLPSQLFSQPWQKPRFLPRLRIKLGGKAWVRGYKVYMKVQKHARCHVLSPFIAYCYSHDIHEQEIISKIALFPGSLPAFHHLAKLAKRGT